MITFLTVMLFVAAGICAAFYLLWQRANARTARVRRTAYDEHTATETRCREFEEAIQKQRDELERLARWEPIARRADAGRRRAEEKVRELEAELERQRAEATRLARYEPAARDAEAGRRHAEEKVRELATELERQRAEVARLARWEKVADAVERARRVIAAAEKRRIDAEMSADELLARARGEAAAILDDATGRHRELTQQGNAELKRAHAEAKTLLNTAIVQAGTIVAQGQKRADQVAGAAAELRRNYERYEQTARALTNIVEGYGSAYLKPAAGLLDELAEDFAHTDAGRQLKLAREVTQGLIERGLAATCDYVEAGRREGAQAFVLDAFNGKVDSILSRVRHDNYGTLEQAIRDACATVNHGGRAFREARITEEYLTARLLELKWAVVVQELKKRDQEEQRAFREWIREEQQAQREYEKAMREAAKEEDTLRKAMARAEAQIAAATAEQRARYETQLAELKVKLQEAEEKNQRAISMAQQTRRGHVYIISNIGSLGEHVYKIGLTRRLEPLDRVKELGDASVPFEFDVHAIILSDDAPALETQLHKQFVLNQVNKVNHRKEFFRADLAAIRQQVEALGIEAKWTMTAAAREYRESLAIERAIEADPEAREAWLNRQLTLDPVEQRELVGVEEE
jgi:hypothetical protein